MSRRFAAFSFILATAFLAMGMRGAWAAEESFLDQDAEAALQSLYSTSSAAKALGEKAKGILVFPVITRAGFIIGVLGGEGVLFEHGKSVAHYSAGAGTAGLQAGAQTYGYALFFMTDADLGYLKKTSNWSIGAGPSVVLADVGMAKDVSTLTQKKGVYAFIFDQKGLMAGLGVVGQKISRIR